MSLVSGDSIAKSESETGNMTNWSAVMQFEVPVHWQIGQGVRRPLVVAKIGSLSDEGRCKGS